jgi:hypothetical protein
VSSIKRKSFQLHHQFGEKMIITRGKVRKPMRILIACEYARSETFDGIAQAMADQWGWIP